MKQNGSTLYTWAKGVGYNSDDETTHYDSFYPHDAGELSDQSSDYYIAVTNASTLLQGVILPGRGRW